MDQGWTGKRMCGDTEKRQKELAVKGGGKEKGSCEDACVEAREVLKF